MHKTCTGTKKNTSFELQSAPNLHRDKKNKVLNFKVHQTCTGTKKKTLPQSTWGGATIPLKFLFFFFVPVQVWCTLEFKTFVFFVHAQVWRTLKFKTLFFFCPCAGLVGFEVQNPMHLFIFVLILFLLLADILDTYGIFCFPCSFLKGQVHF